MYKTMNVTGDQFKKEGVFGEKGVFWGREARMPHLDPSALASSP